MIESRAGAKTPKLDQLKTDIVLGLQELQDQVAKHGRLWNFAYESRLRLDDTDEELEAFNNWIWSSGMEPMLPQKLIGWMVAHGRNLSPEMRALRNNMERLT